MTRHIDPIEEGPETEAFWHMVEEQANAILALQRSGTKPGPLLREGLNNKYRLTYICMVCEAEHRVEGDYQQVTTAAQVLLLQGARSVMVETLQYALLCDAEEADIMLEEDDPSNGDIINNRLQEQFFNTRKP